MKKTALKDKVIGIFKAYEQKNPSVKPIIQELEDASEEAFRDFILNLLNDKELEQYGELVLEELLELVQAEERSEKEAQDQVYT